MYELFKTLHIIGVVVLIGNVTITAYWKVLADRTRDVRLIAHAQHGVTIADWILHALVLCSFWLVVMARPRSRGFL